MNAMLCGAVRAATPVFADAAAAYIAANSFDRPTLVVSREHVATQYDALSAGLGRAHIHYAVKANPAPEIIRLLVRKGSGFDAASRGEIELCLLHILRASPCLRPTAKPSLRRSQRTPPVPAFTSV